MPTINKVNSPVSDYPVWSVWLLALLVFVSHGMLLLNDGVYWDGWQLYGYYLNHDVESLLGIFSDAGSPWAGYFHWAFWSAPNLIFTYKLVLFLGILLSTLLVYLIVQRISILSVRERWFIAAMFCCYSAFQTQVEIITTTALFTYSIFWLGAYVALRSFETTGRSALALRILALVIIGFSFRYSALLVFYFPLLILFLMGRRQAWSGKDLRAKFLALSRYSDFIFLPFAYWIFSRVLWKRQDEYAEYNRIILDPRQWAIDFGQSINNAIVVQFQNVQALADNRPLLAVSIIILGIIVERLFAIRRSNKAREELVESTGQGGSRNFLDMIKIALFAVALLICALFPYLVVGKFPSVEGWNTRHALLISLPVAVGLVAVGRVLHCISLPNLGPGLLKLSAGMLVLAFTLVTCKTYLEWQVRWIKDSSFILNLPTMPKYLVDKVTIYSVNDAYPVGNEFYRSVEYAGMFKMAWGDESRIGFHPNLLQDSEWVLKNVPLKRNLLKDFRSGGWCAMITILPKHPEISRIKLATTYLKHRWFSPAEMTAFLSDVTILELKHFTCPTTSSTVPSQ